MPIKVPVVQTGLEASIDQAAKKAGRSLGVNLGKSSRSIDALSQPLGRITGKADEFTKSMEAANARVLAFGASVGILGAVTKAFKDLVVTTIQVEKQLASINTILNRDAAGLTQFKKEIFDVARNTEQSFDTVATAALELSRQGLGAEEVLSRLNDAMVLSRLSGLGAAESVSGLTAAINSFKKEGLDSAEILNKLSAAAISAAVSEKDLIEAIKRSASVANQAGVSFDELVGVVTAVQQATARGGSVIGNSFKTIFTRLQSFENLTTLSNLGVEIEDAAGKVLPATKIIENLSGVLSKLPAQQAQDISTGLVGRFQIAPFLAILADYQSETKQAIKITEVAAGATNEAYTRNVALNKTLSAAINSSTVSLKEFADVLGTIGVTDSLKNIITAFDTIIQDLTEGLKAEGIGGDLGRGIIKGISNVVSGPGLAIFGAIVAKLFFSLAKFGTQSLTTFFGMAQTSKDIATTQGQIASTLLTNRTVQENILAIENSTLSVEQKRVAQTKFFTTALNEQLAIMGRMQGIAARIAPGVVGGTRGAGRRGRANGYIPSLAGGYSAEKQAIAMGVGGAPSTAKPVSIPNFNFGGGMVGPVVANDSEFLVPNFGGGGGSAIFNQDMAASMGLPPNARPINAFGGIMGMQTSRKGKQIGRDDRFAMLTPEPTPVRIGTGKSSTGEKFKFNIFGFDKNRIKSRDEKGLKDAVTQSGINLANLEADNFRRAGINVTPIKTAKFNAGALDGMVGTIFEESIKATTKQYKRLGTQNNASFDFFGGQISGLKKGVYTNLPSSVRFADAKVNSLQTDNFADKMARFGAGNKNISPRGSKEMMALYRGPSSQKFDKRARVSRMLGVSLAGARSKAGGYIPNFANGEPTYKTPKGRTINLNQALAGFGGKEIFADAKKHVAAQAKAAQAAAAANTKLAKSSGDASGKMLGVLMAASFLQGSMSEVDTGFGRMTQVISGAIMKLSGFAIAASAIGGLGGSGKMGAFTKGLGKAALIFGSISAAGSLLDGILSEVTERHKFTSSAIDDLAIAAATASRFLNELSVEEKTELKASTRQSFFEMAGVGAGMLRKTPDGDFGGFMPFTRNPGTQFQSPELKKQILDASMALRAAGVSEGTEALLAEQLGESAVAALNIPAGAFSIGAFTKGNRVIPDQASAEMAEVMKNMAKSQVAKFEPIEAAFNELGPQALAEFAMARGSGREKIKGMFGKDFSQDFINRQMGIFTGKAARKQDPFGTPKEKVQFQFAQQQLKTQIEKLKGQQAQIKLEEKLIKLQEIQGILTKDEVASAKTNLSNLKFQDGVVLKSAESFTKLVAKAKAYSVSVEAINEARKIFATLTFEELNNADKRAAKQAKIVDALGLEDELASVNKQLYTETLQTQIEGLRVAKAREQAEIALTRELEKQVSVSTLLQKEAREIQNTLESGVLQKDKVRNATLFGRLSAGISLNAATNRMGALDAIEAGTGSIQEVRRIDLAEKLGKSLVSASQTFSENIADGLVDAISKGESLGDTLRNVAADFLNTMSKAFMNNAVNSALNIGGGFFGFNSGGQVRGGSGMKDDVPALLTGGEFVMSKSAVQNYGAGFMGALNSGAVPKYANGGLFTPGTYGQGAISGSSNLLNFATQSYTGGLQDRFLSGSGLAGLALEPQSGRLTMFGRKNSPAFQREQESKRKAFSLFSGQYSKNAQERQSKSENNLLGSILGLGFSIGASTLFGGGLSGLFSKKATGGSVPYSAGIDSVPTMLSGGEFVMNAGAAQRLGAGNLAALNAGAGIGGGGGDGAIVGKLDELNETIASSNTEINITVNSDGTENTNSSNAPEQQRSLAVRIKDVVRQVIEDEKRLGGSLRMA
jgi:TP901 family phage tail tape measure protein